MSHKADKIFETLGKIDHFYRDDYREAASILDDILIRSAELEQQNEALLAQVEAFKNAEILPFRSGGFINKDYDMGRVYVDLPINDAKKLFSVIKCE